MRGSPEADVEPHDSNEFPVDASKTDFSSFVKVISRLFARAPEGPERLCVLPHHSIIARCRVGIFFTSASHILYDRSHPFTAIQLLVSWVDGDPSECEIALLKSHQSSVVERYVDLVHCCGSDQPLHCAARDSCFEANRIPD